MPVRVDRPLAPPHKCAFTLRDTDPEGFFMGETLSGWDPKAAISVRHARELARDLGYVHPDEHERTVQQLADAVAECDRLRGLLTSLNEKFDAIDVLASAGFQARKKPGRPANQVKEKV